MNMKVLAVDPGNHCGLAWSLPDGKHDTMMYFERETEVLNKVKQKPDICVIETFTTGGNISRYGLYTVDLIGGIRALCWAYEIPLVLHEPYVRLPYIQQAKDLLNSMRTNHRWVVHEMDALAHCLAYEQRSEKGLDIPYVNDPLRALYGDRPTNPSSTGTSVHGGGNRPTPQLTPLQAFRAKLREP